MTPNNDFECDVSDASGEMECPSESKSRSLNADERDSLTTAHGSSPQIVNRES